MTSDEVGCIGLGTVGPAMAANRVEAGVSMVVPRHKPGYRRGRRAFRDATVLGSASGVAERAGGHTALVAGYVVEGHVPADLIERLLRERRKVIGLAVPGMPVGSPGMQVPGASAELYQVLTSDRSGQTGAFAKP